MQKSFIADTVKPLQPGSSCNPDIAIFILCYRVHLVGSKPGSRSVLRKLKLQWLLLCICKTDAPGNSKGQDGVFQLMILEHTNLMNSRGRTTRFIHGI